MRNRQVTEHFIDYDDDQCTPLPYIKHRDNISIGNSWCPPMDELLYGNICPELFKVLSYWERIHLDLDIGPGDHQVAYARITEYGKNGINTTEIEIDDDFIEYLRDIKNSQKEKRNLTREEIHEAMKTWVSWKKLIKFKKKIKRRITIKNQG